MSRNAVVPALTATSAPTGAPNPPLDGTMVARPFAVSRHICRCDFQNHRHRRVARIEISTPYPRHAPSGTHHRRQETNRRGQNWGAGRKLNPRCLPRSVETTGLSTPVQRLKPVAEAAARAEWGSRKTQQTGNFPEQRTHYDEVTVKCPTYLVYRKFATLTKVLQA